MIKKFRSAVEVLAIASAEIVAGIVADKVETILANRRAAHTHRPAVIRIGSSGSYLSLDGSTVVLGPMSDTEWVVAVATHGENDPKVASVVKWTPIGGIKLCRDCGQLYFSEERS